MNILVVGSGGREHAICAAFAKSDKVSDIFCANGNAGIAEIAACVDIRPEETVRLAEFAEENKIGLTFVGGETPLALGISDEFERRGLKIIGVSKAAATLEASKAFAKGFMQRHGVPTAAYKTAHSPAEALAILNSGSFGGPDSPVVVKADGLAAGKGVIVAAGRSEAADAIKGLESLVGVDAASAIVLEECLSGREVSLILFVDGRNFALMPATRDHKRIGDGDTGPNTGGMGTFTDDSMLTAEQLRTITKTIIEPTVEGCAADGFPFCGILFLGLMLTETGAKVLEYNVRFGDPETQSILVRLETDLVDICEAMAAGALDKCDIRWRKGSSATIVLAAEGYPASPKKGDVINGIAAAAALPEVSIFHAGTAENENGEMITAGGRVLGVTAIGDDLETALERAYSASANISWSGMQFRRDIGR